MDSCEIQLNLNEIPKKIEIFVEKAKCSVVKHGHRIARKKVRIKNIENPALQPAHKCLPKSILEDRNTETEHFFMKIIDFRVKKH